MRDDNATADAVYFLSVTIALMAIFHAFTTKPQPVRVQVADGSECTCE